MPKLLLSQIRRLYFVFFLFQVLSHWSTFASENSPSFSAGQEAFTPEELPSVSLNPVFDQEVAAISQNPSNQIPADVQKLITRAGNAKRALRSACIEGLEEAVLYLLKNEEIDKADINRALIRALDFGRKEMVLDILKDKTIEAADAKKIFMRAIKSASFSDIVLYLLSDDRIEAEDVKEALFNTENEQMFSILLNDERIEPVDVKKALIAASSRGNKKIVFPLLADERIETADVKEAFQSACGGRDTKSIIVRLLDDPQIETDDVKKAFQVACKNDHYTVISLLIADKGIEKADKIEGIQNLPSEKSRSGYSTIELLLGGLQPDASFLKVCFLKACARNDLLIIQWLLEGKN